jgi:hypothetical protein
MTILVCLLLQDGCVINGEKFPSDPKLDSTPMLRITVDFNDKLMTEAFEELSKQSGVPLVWQGDPKETLSISAQNAPIVGVLAAIARIKECSFEEWMRGYQMPATWFKATVKGFQVKGPLVLVWYGRATWEAYVATNKRGTVTRIAAALYRDPGHRLGFGPGIHVWEHNTMVFNGSIKPKTLGKESDTSEHIPQWEFESEALSGDKVTVDLNMNIRAPSSVKRGVFSAEEGQGMKLGKKIATIESIQKEKEKVIVKVRMIHADSMLLKKAQRTNEEEEKLKRVKGAWTELDIDTAFAVTKDGRRFIGSVMPQREKEWEGNLNEITFRGDGLNLDQIEIFQIEAHEEFQVPFKLVDVPLK